MDKKVRSLSLNEKLYTVGERITPPFAIQLVLKGEGKINEPVWREAVSVLVEKIPPLAFKIKGGSWFHSDSEPWLFFHDFPFDNNLNSDLLKSRLAAKKGRAYEVHVFQGECSTLVIRVLHSLMDGAGVLAMVYALFDLINQKPVAAFKGYPSDEEYRKRQKSTAADKRTGYPFKWKALEKPDRPGQGYRNGLVSVNNKINTLTAKLAAWHTRETNADGRFLIPVDVRRHDTGPKSVANLSLPVYLDAKAGESTEAIHARLLMELSKNNELAKNPFEPFGKYISPFILEALLKKATKHAQLHNTFPLSGFLSDLGFVDIDRLSTATFFCTDLFLLPVHVPLAPFCVLACHHKNGTRIGISVPKGYDMDSITSGLVNIFQSQTVATKEVGDDLFSELALKIRSLWAQVLNLEEIQINKSDSYANLGGSSLNLLQIIDRVEKEILKEGSTELITQVVKHGGELTIGKMEDILLKQEIL